MQKDRTGRNLTQENFDLLLGWLDSNLEYAGNKYEEIRLRLIKIFSSRGCPDVEDLADETINRVATRIKDLRDTYQGDPALYFYGVANNVYRESLRKRSNFISPPEADMPREEDPEKEYECLEKCLQTLRSDNRELILRYYQEENTAKIEARKDLAARLGVSLRGLRIRAIRIRAALHQCVQQCVEKQESDTM